MTESCRVAIVGSGPAGLGAAYTLRRMGIEDVVVLERETAPGGIPRHCGHRLFGIAEFGRLMSGPAYARRLVDLAGVEIRTAHTVIGLDDGELALATPAGPARLRAERVLVATGARETPRPPRLVSGTRPMGVLTTGALQQFVHLKHMRPMESCVVVGTELVSFSALTTLRHAGIEAVAMVEEGPRITAWWFAAAYPRLIGVPIKLETRLREIQGGTRVNGVILESADGTVERLACDGVVFTGGYVPDSVLIRNSRLAVTPRLFAPIIDQTWRCSDPNVFAAGNVLRPIETASWAFREGKAAGEAIARSLDGEERLGRLIPIDWTAPIRVVTPQRIRWPGPPLGSLQMKLRMEREARGLLCVLVDNELVWSRRLHALPERRISLPRRLPIAQAAAVRVEFRE